MSHTTRMTRITITSIRSMLTGSAYLLIAIRGVYWSNSLL